MIRFVCPSCHARLNAPGEASGKRGKCNKCGIRITIPSAAQISDEETERFLSESASQGNGHAHSHPQLVTSDTNQPGRDALSPSHSQPPASINSHHAPNNVDVSIVIDKSQLHQKINETIRDYDILAGKAAAVWSDDDVASATNAIKAAGVGMLTGSLFGLGIAEGAAVAFKQAQIEGHVLNETAEEKRKRRWLEAKGRLADKGYPVESPVSLHLIVEALRACDAVALRNCLSSTETSTQFGALAAFSELGKASPPAAKDWLIPLLRADDAALRLRALKTLRTLGRPAMSYAVPDIIAAMLDHGGRLSILDCELVLLDIEPLSIRVIPGIVAALYNSPPAVRTTAICQLGRLGVRAEVALSELEALATRKDCDHSERNELFQVIRQIKSAQATHAESQTKRDQERTEILHKKKLARVENLDQWSLVLYALGCVLTAFSLLVLVNVVREPDSNGFVAVFFLAVMCATVLGFARYAQTQAFFAKNEASSRAITEQVAQQNAQPDTNKSSDSILS